MWGRVVSDFAGKGVGLAGKGLGKAVEAASYVGEVVAPVTPDVTPIEDGSYPHIARPPKSSSGEENNRFLQEKSERDSAEIEELKVLLDQSHADRARSVEELSGVEEKFHQSLQGFQGLLKEREQEIETLRIRVSQFESTPGHLPATGGDREVIVNGEGIGGGLEVAKVIVEQTAAQKIEDNTTGTLAERSLPSSDRKEEARTKRTVDTSSQVDENLKASQGMDEDSVERELYHLRRSLENSEEEKLITARRAGVAEGEAKALAARAGDLEMEVAGLRESLQAAEEDASQMSEKARSLESDVAQLQSSVFSAFAELPGVCNAIKNENADGPSMKTSVMQIVHGVVVALQEKERREKEWGDKLAGLVKDLARTGVVVGGEMKGRSTAGLKEDFGDGMKGGMDVMLREFEVLVQDIVSKLEGTQGNGGQEGLLAELGKQENTNKQLKQVIVQMREVSRSQGHEAESIRKERDLAEEARLLAMSEKAFAESEANMLKEKLRRAEDMLKEKETVGNGEEKLRAHLAEAEAKARRECDALRVEEAALTENLMTERRDHQASLRREAALATEATALRADLSIATADKNMAETALENLQCVLEQFQREHTTEADVAEARCRKAVEKQAADYEVKEASLKAVYELRLEEMKRLEVRSSSTKDKEIVRMREEVRTTRTALEAALAQLQEGQDDTLDRRLVTNLVVRYIEARNKKEVLEVMARMLNFTQEEKESVGLGQHRSSLPGLLTAMFRPGEEEHAVSTEEITGDNLSDMWINFLMAETAQAEGAPHSGLQPSR